MQIKSFLKLVELPTKVASMIPLLLGTIYTVYHFHQFSLKNFILMFASLLCIDMFTTALNNYMDFKKAVKREGYNYEGHNAIVKYGLNEFTVLGVMAILLLLAVTIGVILFLNTDLIVLIFGVASFAVGTIYSFGPVPISRTPFGEILSGGVMGFGILFLSIYIHVFNLNIITLNLNLETLNLGINLIETGSIFLLSVITICGIANIMLANNICDIEDDIENHRYTLAVYIGRKNSLILYRSLYLIAYVDLVALIILQIIPWVCILASLTLWPVWKNIKRFDLEQTKKNTFPLVIQNFFLLTVPLELIFLVSIPFFVENALKTL